MNTSTRRIVVPAALAVAIAGCAQAQQVSPARPEGSSVQYSWQKPHAKVLETGDIQWAPEPFVFKAGKAIRYIDFDAGDDNNDGTTKQKPWKHHPWDRAASGKAAASSDADTFVFKRGVIYRGELVAKASGSPDLPIRLTSDPSWGAGQAMVYGSRRITGGWKRAGATTAPGFPEPQRIWYQDLGNVQQPFSLWEIRAGKVLRIPIARDPNWTVTNADDVKSNWYTWQTTRQEKVAPKEGEQQNQGEEKVWATDKQHLIEKDPDAYKGGTVWSEYVSVMGQPYAAPIEAYDPATGSIKFGGPWGNAAGTSHPIINNRYFLENLPRFLDSPGEYYYAKEGPNAGRLYVRLADDRSPNTTAIELPQTLTAIDIRDQSHIEITGLAFRFGTITHLQERWWTIAEQDQATIRVLGNCDGIRISNCSFEYLPMGIRAKALGDNVVLDHLAVTDCRFEYTDQEALHISHGGGREKLNGELRNVQVLRNYFHEIGHRPPRANQAPTLTVEFGKFVEVAGNVLDRTYGSGLFIFGGKGGGSLYEVPVSRVLVHHNKVTDPLLTINDYGGIETWQGGPFYVYDNISGNPGGYWNFSSAGQKDPAKRTHTTARFGFAYYLDGSFKNYLFNNIAWGKSNDLSSPLANTAALQEIIGFDNVFANNTFYNFAAGARRQAPQAGRDAYLGNIWQDMSELNFRHADVDRSQDVNLERAMQDKDHAYDTTAYANNVFYGHPRVFGSFQSHGPIHKTSEEFQASLQKEKAKGDNLGAVAQQPPIPNAARHDFRPGPSAAAQKAVKQFVPWGLYETVGEWNFQENKETPNLIRDASWFMTGQYTDRETYRHTARYDLKGQNLTADSYVPGDLENWTKGALKLNGKDQYLVLADADLKKDLPGQRGAAIPGNQRKTADMSDNSFLIEVVFRMQPGTQGGFIASKADPTTGYSLLVNKDGMAGVMVRTKPKVVLSLDGNMADGKWHHFIGEVDRPASMIRLYQDGKFIQESPLGDIAKDASLSNSGDLLIGKAPTGHSTSSPECFAGEIDFLRICRGTLKDANTTIEELYAWEFDGPQYRDFVGQKVDFSQRPAGALAK